MQVRAVNQLARCGAVRGATRPQAMAPAAAVGGQRWNSFIKNVMDQVKKDMEADPKLKKDFDTWQKTSAKVQTRGEKTQERMDEWGSRLKSASLKTSELLSSMKEKTADFRGDAARRANEATEGNENLKKMEEFMKKQYETGSTASSTAAQKAKGVFAGVVDKTSGGVNWLGGEHEKNEKLKKWRESQAFRDAAMAETQEKMSAAEKAAKVAEDAKLAMQAGEGEEIDPLKVAEAEAAAAAAQKAAEEMDMGSAVVVSKTQSGSSWDRFGAGIKDMPFLSNVFDNPLFDRLFGESEIAASIREMKDLDPNFFLEEFAEEIENVVAPHIVQTYLDGDQESLELHCGEAAFAAVNASIKARITNKMTLDTNILAGPKEVELKGAQRMDKGPPCFIWTFNTQQVNCLKDSEGEIIEGAVDDIRTVYYAMAVTMHPEMEKTLEYPWQVSELAIVGNQPCW